MLHEQFDRFFQGFRRDAHPMAIMVGAVGALSAFYHDSTNINDPQQRMISAHRLIAKMPTIAARAFKYSVGQPFVHPRNDLSYTENFLRMCFSVPAEDWKPNPVLTKRHGPHLHPARRPRAERVDLDGPPGRLVGANPFACIAAGIACLWGPAHGGANEEALNMLKEIGTADRIPEYVQGVKDSTLPPDGLRPPGLQELRPARDGHAEDLPRGAGGSRPRRRPAAEGGDGAREDRARATRISSSASSTRTSTSTRASPCARSGFPPEMFTVLFALARTVGWICPVEGNDRGPGAEDRPPAPDLHGRRSATTWSVDKRG